MRFAALLATLTVMISFSGLAGAGSQSDELDYVYIQPLVGSETLHLQTGTAATVMRGAIIGEGHTTSSLSLGAAMGVRFRAIRLAIILQRGSHDADTGVSMTEVTTDKVLGEIGLHAWLGRGVALSPHLALGYASLHAGTMPGTVGGVGAKAGVNLEFYPTSAFSVALRLDFDMQAYTGVAFFSYAYGFTIATGVGVHL